MYTRMLADCCTSSSNAAALLRGIKRNEQVLKVAPRLRSEIGKPVTKPVVVPLIYSEIDTRKDVRLLAGRALIAELSHDNDVGRITVADFRLRSRLRHRHAWPLESCQALDRQPAKSLQVIKDGVVFLKPNHIGITNHVSVALEERLLKQHERESCIIEIAQVNFAFIRVQNVGQGAIEIRYSHSNLA